VPREWTDRADPSPHELAGLSPTQFDIDLLLELVNLMEQVAAQAAPKELPQLTDKEIDK
jgi:hypothetical protein